MKKFLIALITMSFISNVAFADCDYSKIQKVEGGYLYTKDLHLCVGEMKQDLEISQKQNEKLVKALDLKDLALTKADQRTELWMNTAFKLEDRVNTLDEMRKTNQWLYFGLGIATMFVATYAASQLNHR